MERPGMKYIGIDPFEPLTKHLGDKYEMDMARDRDKLLRYELSKFRRLAENIDGIQAGFYAVGAETNAGKTSFLCNLTLDLLDSNKNLTGIYFSLDIWSCLDTVVLISEARKHSKKLKGKLLIYKKVVGTTQDEKQGRY